MSNDGYTTLEQAVTLSKCGAFADTSDGHYVLQTLDGSVWSFFNYKADKFDKNTVAAWSLGAVLGIMPKVIKDNNGVVYHLDVNSQYTADGHFEWVVKYESDDYSLTWLKIFDTSMMGALVSAYQRIIDMVIKDELTILLEYVEH